MYAKAKKPGTLQTAQLICEKESSSLVSDCLTRLMTPEDWEKYGPLNIRKLKKK
ncbi:hypothetical protein [Desulfosporosinus sp. FKB]|uniref:hypothetical protein n=1 Tax=Desulfosporosinus sp. FKB TaxID=1969835 RepID=UPI00148383B3|nr:hypothetical protein [Desulfosporosinus sp. FKB]